MKVVPVTEPGTGSGTSIVPDSTGGSGTGAKFSSGRVLVLTARNPEYAS